MRDGKPIEIVLASEDDEAAVRSCLSEAALPLEGLELAFPAGFVVARRADGIVGCAGLEIHGPDALLRSLVVVTSARKTGLGAELVANRLEAARAGGLASMFAITTTAADFFEHLGFERIARDMVPPGIRASAEFASICPSSAAVLRKSLRS